MKNKVFLVIKAEITTYPPILTILHHLLEMNLTPVVVGVFNQIEVRKYYENRGMEYIPTIQYNPKSNLIDKLYKQIQYKREVKQILKKRYKEGDYVWIFNLETMMLLDDIVSKYKTILHFFEFVGKSFNWKYRLLNPFYSMEDTLAKSYRVIHCEYNRAQISMGLYGIKQLPLVLPNKPLFPKDIFENIPDWIKDRLEKFDRKTDGKKIILYQGAFTGKERRLNEFCEAIDYLPNEYVFVAMGKETSYSKELQKGYANPNVIFEDYLPAPYHLLITQKANIGILTYFPLSKNFVDVINPIYCAPNKIFEYSYFGIPMIGNNIPGLKYPFKEYQCGEVVPIPLSAQQIASAIITINNDYSQYSVGAKKLYESVDIYSLMKSIFNAQ
ncbi:MAG: glycosyltransferase family 4 protein [Barnesiella sp.]|nr:glycosyltransferase family 4 protein [Barnesiella sp.]